MFGATLASAYPAAARTRAARGDDGADTATARAATAVPDVEPWSGERAGAVRERASFDMGTPYG